MHELRTTIREEISKCTFSSDCVVEEVRKVVKEDWNSKARSDFRFQLEKRVDVLEERILRAVGTEFRKLEVLISDKMREFVDVVKGCNNETISSMTRNLESQPQKFTWEQINSFADRERKNLQLIVEYAQSLRQYDRPHLSLPPSGSSFSSGFHVPQPLHSFYGREVQGMDMLHNQSSNATEELLRRVRENSAPAFQSLRLTPPKATQQNQLSEIDGQRMVFSEDEPSRNVRESSQVGRDNRGEIGYDELLEFYNRSSKTKPSDQRK